MTALVWFRNDLRSLDHPALTAACGKHDQVRAIYILCPQQLDHHGIAPIRRHFLRSALDALSQQLADLGIPLDIIDSGHFKDVPDTLDLYCREHSITALHAHKEWLVDEIQRDNACAERINIPFYLIDDSLLSPDRITKADGQPYKVFTPFSRLCRKELAAAFPRVIPSPPAKTRATPIKPVKCPRFGPEKDSSAWPSNQEDTLTQLRQFCAERANDYQKHRDFPALDGTSRLSAVLAHGIISPRQCLARLQMECGDEIWDAKSDAGTWFNELLWREFYRHVAYHFPRVVMGRAFQVNTEAIAWPNDPDLFQAWCEGRTGYPIVDAAMRQLTETGWMHNRLRMISASFLCKDLHIDWRWGERYFLENLIDADFASNNGGWQWAASTGTDAAPYFRIFNPTTQGLRFDPDGDFILRFIPELKGLTGKQLHQPPEHGDYPTPIIDHKERRNITLALFQEIRD
ncbi:Deoxyribodipyrimidine photo-lyase [Zhongshania aliphaticivorans]|uniref:Deoxyribodipyrimidine photo-lyase n=1 Tax=Zhongshania aliphaticivorans TaxID=1470434 RepID=A0A5S9PLH3_9GAMM|nr:deoxyribodipyrimidine photo-lyase [Zhongshania aliphaticivorans]CAA0104963.1 Deoxyribodipyrimidine photo-lyase [Zhongshania aliphaticivorans]CAA0105267.1 Deoxyribodipyrimidine photo-lyase [Zhongshania aliphaticivorans]